MATKKKLLQAAAGQAGGAGLDVNEVFSTYLYEGTGSNITVTHNIDLSTEGGLVWVRPRISSNHWLWDSARGTQYSLATDNTAVQTDMSPNGTVFNTDGFTDRMGWGSGTDIASWTFRKAPKFFDVVTYTGNGTNPRTISHNLDAEVGMMVIKRLDTSSNWHVYHRSWSGYGEMNLSAAFSSYAGLWPSAPTSTTFTLDDNAVTNASGSTYVAYLFAHNDDDGEFGPDSDQDIIKCGSYTTDGSGNATIDLGFEPQWLLRKRTDASQNWTIYDSMRGWTSNDDDALEPNTATAEAVNGNQYNLTPTGFEAKEHGSNRTYIYVAIRRGSLFTPEDADDVFSIDTWGGGPPAHETSGHVCDFAIQKNVTGGSSWTVGDRQMGPKKIMTDQAAAESNSSNSKFDYQNGWWDSSASLTNYTSYMWARAPGFFDMVHYTGNGAAGHAIDHNLGVSPEMIWIKKKSEVSYAGWAVYYGQSSNLYLNETAAAGYYYSNAVTGVSDTTFTLGGNTDVNDHAESHVAYLFGTVSGVSKVGTVSHTTGTRTYVDCGFTAGARFVVFKYADSATGLGNDPANWHVFDTVRGIVGGIDSRLSINETDAEITTGNDYIDPDNAGFSLPSGHPTGTYVFYAIA